MRFLFLILALSCLLPGCAEAKTEAVPRDAVRYQRDLTREARAVWGLNAPVATFAAQIHQESRWRADAESPVGAQGMTQFMPGTTRWIAGAFPHELGDADPYNPNWAMRALVRYDLYLHKRVWGETRFDLMHAALRSYNGGLGHWQREATKVAPSVDRASIDAACGTARRNISHCRENLGYPKSILIDLQPLYRSWGPGVSA